MSAVNAIDRDMKQIPVKLATGEAIRPRGALIKSIIEEFAPRFVPGGVLAYAGDTGRKLAYIDASLLTKLGVAVDGHSKMPDVVLYDPKREQIFLVDSVASRGPVDGKRREELARLFANSKVDLVYVTAFPSRAVMAGQLEEIAWETKAWCADAPSHLIHFDGGRLMGPYRSGVE